MMTPKPLQTPSACWWFASVAILIAFPTAELFGQDAFDTAIAFRGKLKDVRRGVLIVEREDGTETAVKLGDDPVHTVFMAEAKAAFIRQGTLVRVESMFGPAGTPPEPIDAVELFVPFTPKNKNSNFTERYIPGVYSLSGEPANANGKPAGFQPGNYRVVGTVVAINSSGLLVQAGQLRVPLPIAADAKLLIRYNSLQLAQPGDQVNVSGFHSPPDETKVIGDNVQISTDRIYGETPEKPSRKKRGKDDAEIKPDAAPEEDSKPAADAE